MQKVYKHLKRGDIPPLGNRVEEDGITGSVAKVF
jgi:hypothetical protein